MMYVDLSRIIDTEPLLSDVFSLISDEDLIEEINERCNNNEFILNMINSLDEDIIETISKHLSNESD